MHRRLILAAPLGAILTRPVTAQQSGPLVAAAANLQVALEEALPAFQAETGITPRVVFGSSGNFTRQIEQGAPFELFLSADEDFVQRLAGRGLLRDDGVLYAIGRIALFAPHGSPLRPEDGLDGLRAALAAGRIQRFAIANPELAPYGRAAEQALRAAGLWDAIRPRLVFGENVVQATQFAATGGSQGGIIAYTLALGPGPRARGTSHLLPETLHEPLRQRMALTRQATPAAERLYTWLQAPSGRDVLRRHGFVLPGE